MDLKKSSVTIFILCFFLFFVSNLIFKEYKKIQLYYLIHDIASFKVNIGNEYYLIKKGQVEGKDQKNTAMRIAAFYQWNKEDPLFTSPNFDTSKFRESINNLKVEQEKTLSLIKSGDNLYPTEFLDSMADSSDLQEKFMLQPSLLLAKKLAKTMEKTANYYIKDAKLLKSLVDKDKFIQLVLFEKVSDKDIVLSDIGKIIDNGNELLVEAEKRKACLDGKGDCMRPSSTFPKSLKTTVYKDTEPELIEGDIVNYSYKDRKYDLRGPYVASSPCYVRGEKKTSENEYYYVRYVDDDQSLPDIPPVNVELATNMYFERISEQTDIVFRKKLLDENILYTMSLTSAPYKCPYLGYFAQILMLDNFLKERKPILRKEFINNGSINQKIADMSARVEESFFNRKYPSFEEGKQVADNYGYIYNIISNNQPDNLKLRDELLSRKLEIERSLSQIDLAFEFVNFFIGDIRRFEEDEFANNTDFSKKVVLPSLIFTVHTFRSYYGLMYLPFTRSVWRVDSDLDYFNKNVIVNDAVGFNSHNLDYKTAKTKYSTEEILKWFTPRDYRLK